MESRYPETVEEARDIFRELLMERTGLSSEELDEIPLMEFHIRFGKRTSNPEHIYTGEELKTLFDNPAELKLDLKSDVIYFGHKKLSRMYSEKDGFFWKALSFYVTYGVTVPQENIKRVRTPEEMGYVFRGEKPVVNNSWEAQIINSRIEIDHPIDARYPDGKVVRGSFDRDLTQRLEMALDEF